MTSLPAQDMASLTITVKVPCLVCKKVLSFTNVLRHMKTVHNEKIGRRWICKEDGKVFQSEQRLVQHDKKHRPEICETEIFQCPDCEYRTLCKDYLGDHRRLMHVQTSHGQYICIAGKCSTKPIGFPNQARLEKHKTCHSNAKCAKCGKMFGAKRNLTRHTKKKHEEDQGNTSVNSNISEGDMNGNTPDERQDPLIN